MLVQSRNFRVTGLAWWVTCLRPDDEARLTLTVANRFVSASTSKKLCFIHVFVRQQNVSVLKNRRTDFLLLCSPLQAVRSSPSPRSWECFAVIYTTVDPRRGWANIARPSDYWKIAPYDCLHSSCRQSTCCAHPPKHQPFMCFAFSLSTPST